MPADTAWMLVSTALVLLMTPGAGVLLRRSGPGEERAQHDDDELRRARRRRASSWALLGYSLAFGDGNALSAGSAFAFLKDVGVEAKGTIPHVLFMAYQATFAIITAALISGAIVERMRFGPYLAFIALWTLFVYAPDRALGLGRRLAL